MLKVVSFHREIKLLEHLLSDTVRLIHHTHVIKAIKKLVHAYDILDVTIRIEREFDEFKYQPPWDLSTAKELHHIRCDLLTYHADAFKPATVLPQYYNKIGNLLDKMHFRLNKGGQT
jgi:hypothetical protein